MPQLIIGHTTHEAARVWVRGTPRRRFVRIRLDSSHGSVASDTLELDAEHDFTWAETLPGLRPETTYEVRARFGSEARDLERAARVDHDEVRGRLRTFPPSGTPAPFAFLHGSCNLSTVSLDNTASLALGAAAAVAAERSLGRTGGRDADPSEERERSDEALRARLREAGWLLRGLLRVGDFAARSLYGVYFLWERLSFRLGRGSRDAPPEWNDRVSLVYAVFYLVYSLTGYKQSERMLPSPFEHVCALVERGPLEEPTLGEDDGRTERSRKPRPDFAIHAGDQIYFDFPFPNRKPTLEGYRRAYREAWFEDEHLRRFLTLCPHYMTLDDHEIVDGFALDAPWLPKGRQPSSYVKDAKRAYREYTASRHPPASTHPPAEDEPLFYHFSYGSARFFVLDTRSRRSLYRGEMLGSEQMCQLKSWLRENKSDVKFIVSSVPFVAEVRSTQVEGSGMPDEREDKWNGPSFRARRNALAALLHEEQIGRVVFLVGDMHCAYHATMHVGWPHDRITVHELAGGPVYQVQFGRRSDFADEYRGFVGADGKTPFRSFLQKFHGAASSVLYVELSPGDSPELRWRVLRTGPDLNETVESSGDEPALRSLSGRIRFQELRHS